MFSETGYWIYDRGVGDWRCSECGCAPKTLGNICYQCGAKIKGTQGMPEKKNKRKIKVGGFYLYETYD